MFHQNRMKLMQLSVPLAHVKDMHRLSRCTSFRNHRYGITRYNNGISKREKTKVWIVFGPVPEK
jgi:hypothetical protein